MRKFLKRALIVLGSTVASLGLYLGYLQLSGNFHEIIPGVLYRSAQPTPSSLESYIKQYGIKSVVNLRGPSKRDWYVEEVATTKRMNAEHIDFQMSAGRELTPAESEKLIALLRDAPKPMLIHCMAGADRTGLASVIYLQQIANVDEDDAEWQLSPVYGHINLPFLRAYAMDRTWLGLEKLLGIEES